MAIIAKSIQIGQKAVEAARKGVTVDQLKQEETNKLKQMAQTAKAAVKPKRMVDPSSSNETEVSDDINIIIKRKSDFLDDLTKE